MNPTLEELVATVFGIQAGDVNDDLAYDSIPQWDSFNHVNLMLELESSYGKTIDEDLMVELTTIKAIRDFVSTDGNGGC